VGKAQLYDAFPSVQLSLLAHYCSGLKQSKPFFQESMSIWAYIIRTALCSRIKKKFNFLRKIRSCLIVFAGLLQSQFLDV
jgi:hypothetical protein